MMAVVEILIYFLVIFLYDSGIRNYEMRKIIMKCVTLDCEPIASAAEFHKALAAIMEFPAEYGENLDAMFDCLTENREDRELILLNWHKLSYTLKDYAEKILYVFHCACGENRHLTVTMHP